MLQGRSSSAAASFLATVVRWRNCVNKHTHTQRHTYMHVSTLLHTLTQSNCHAKQTSKRTNYYGIFRAVLSSYIQCTLVCVCGCVTVGVCVYDNTNNLMTLTFGFLPYFSLVLLALHVHVHVHGK